MKDKKAETKRDPPRTSDGDQGRPKADTKVTEGKKGMKRLEELTRKIVRTGSLFLFHPL